MAGKLSDTVSLHAVTTLTVEALVELVAETLTHEQVIPFIRRLDEEFEDWDVTLDLAAYFEEQRQVHDALQDDITDAYVEVSRPGDEA